MDAANQKPKSPLFGKGRSPAGASGNAPTMRRGLTVAQRLFAIAFALLIPLLATVTVLFNQQQSDINFAVRERDGATYVKEIGQLLQIIALHRGLTYRQGLGDRDAIGQRQKAFDEIGIVFAKLDPLDRRFGDVFQSSAVYKALRDGWSNLAGNLMTRTAAEGFEAHNSLIQDKLFGLLRVVTNNSNLILDPALDTYYLMDLTTQRFPAVINSLGQLRGLGAGMLQVNQQTPQERATLAALLTNLEDGDVLFIDEIHRLAPAVEEILYPAMEDRALDLMIGEGPSARSVRIDLPKFTLVGATTRQGLLTTPLRDRFGIPVRLHFYTVDELEKVVTRAASLLGLDIAPDGATEVAKRSRGTPRIAGRLLRRVRDFANVAGDVSVTRAVADAALTRLEVDGMGLDAMDRRYLMMIADIYKGGPVGVETLAAGLSEPRDTIEEVIEPYLIQLGLVARTARGRCLNAMAWKHLGLTPPRDTQDELFDQPE